MRFKVLVDNNTYIDEYFVGEPALSYFIEDNQSKILFDTGYSDVFLKNAEKMGIDLKQVDTIVFSHGHNDHTRGFQYLHEYTNLSNVTVVAHPFCFQSKIFELEDIGSPFSAEKMKNICKLKLSDVPLQISENITFLGEIPNINDFEVRRTIGACNNNGMWIEDTLKEDSALVYRGEEGLFIITGCSHSGICNIVEYAKRVCNEDQIAGIIGGFHLFEVDEQLIKTIDYLGRNQVKHLYPCHCVSFQAKARLNETIRVNEVGVGLTLEL